MNHLINQIFQYGTQFALNKRLDAGKVMTELENYSELWSPYNPDKGLRFNRDGLCVINNTGKCGPGPAISSLRDWNRKYSTALNEYDFTIPTEVFHTSTEIRRFLEEDDFKSMCCRTHFLRLRPGGYFPPHRDHTGTEQTTFRIIVPISNVNPPHVRFITEDRTLTWEQGSTYVVNTVLEHTLINVSTKDSIWLVINAILNDKMVNYITRNLFIT